MELNTEEKALLIESINFSIAYRINSGTRMSEIATLKKMKKKIEQK